MAEPAERSRTLDDEAAAPAAIVAVEASVDPTPDPVTNMDVVDQSTVDEPGVPTVVVDPFTPHQAADSSPTMDIQSIVASGIIDVAAEIKPEPKRPVARVVVPAEWRDSKTSREPSTARVVVPATTTAPMTPVKPGMASDAGSALGYLALGASLVVLVGLWWLQDVPMPMPEPMPARGSERTPELVSEPVLEPMPARGSERTPLPELVPAPTSSRAAVPAPEVRSSEKPQGVIGSSSEIRTPPSGTVSHAAKAFRRLPVAIQDGPPLAGIGATGIHVDAIALGSNVVRSSCVDENTQFSVSETKRINLCFRVVHPRADEQVTVLWRKDGQTQRRSKVVIAPRHAYRTRAVLVLGPAHVGAWTTHVMSADGVELASLAFQVMP